MQYDIGMRGLHVVAFATKMILYYTIIYYDPMLIKKGSIQK
jgi:hypothetical protein